MSAAAAPRVREAGEFGRVALLYGGRSAEREVSLQSGRMVHEALARLGVEVRAIDVGHDVLEQLERGGFDRACIMLHGRGGEDGTMQGLLEILELPYTGSGVLGSAIGMDKRRTKLIWQALGIATPPFRILGGERDAARAAEALGFPLMVKPVHEGSSIGAAKVTDQEGLLSAWWAAARYDAEVMAEPWIDGVEYTVSILGQEALPLIRLETPRTFYDYEAKYADGAGTSYVCPCGLEPEREQTLQALSLQAFDAVGASGWGRVDLMCDPRGEPRFLEVNTVPGMTGHSLVPMAAAAAGIDFDTLVWRILETSLR